MSPSFIEPAEAAFIETASEEAVVEAAVRLRDQRLPKHSWLDGSNRYRHAVVSKISRDTRSRTTTLQEADMAEYVAASAPLHCVDGWAYLGRALSAHAQGDSDAARHLAYYAELRAAMSTLACTGIGIFNDRHIVVRANGDVTWLRSKRTHEMTWLVLEFWASLPGTAAVLAEVFRPRSVSIEDWIDAMPGSGSWQAIAAAWLQRWGLDLSLFESDRSARNESSYRPTRIAGRRSLGVVEAIEFLREVWLAFEPSVGATFARLDLHLLRRSLETTFRGTEGVPPEKKRPEWEQAVDGVLAATTDEGAGREELRDFLTRRIEPAELPLLALAEEAGSPSELDHHLRVISRAALLLRVASGFSARLLTRAAIGVEDLRFWWRFLGEDRGLWEPASVPSALSDLWADIEEALDDMDAITAGDATASASYHGFLHRCAEPILVLSGCERVGLWSLAV